MPKRRDLDDLERKMICHLRGEGYSVERIYRALGISPHIVKAALCVERAHAPGQNGPLQSQMSQRGNFQ
jgi:hypothetical protein